MTDPKYLLYYLLLSSVVLSSCNIWTKIPEDKQLLVSNEINILDAEDAEVDDLESFKASIRSLDSYQSVNTKTLQLYHRKLNRYYKLVEKADSAKIERKKLRGRIEEPSYYIENKSDSTAKDITGFLMNRGYFNAHTKAVDTVFGKQAKTVFNVRLNDLVRVSEDSFYYPNDSIAQLLKPTEPTSFLRKGEPLTQRNEALEYERITKHMRNNGYAYFTTQNLIPIRGYRQTDSSYSAEIVFKQDLVGNSLKSFRVGDILVNRYYNTQRPTFDTSLFDGYLFTETNSLNVVKKKNIARNILFNTGELYNEDLINQTRRRLRQLKYYSTPNIIPTINPIDSSVIDFRILMTPQPRYALSGNFGINYISADPNLMGWTAGLTLSDHNFLGGSEIFEASVDAEFQYVIGPLDSAQSRRNISTYGSLVRLEIPRFIKSIYPYSLTRNLTIGNENFYDLMNTYATSNFLLEYRYEDYSSIQRSTTLTAQAGYKVFWPDGRRDLTINHIDISYFKPVRGAMFDSTSNPLRDRSFNTVLSTALFVGEIIYNHRSKIKEIGWSYNSSTQLEFSGLEAMAIDAIRGSNDTLSIGNTEFARYIRFDQYFTLAKKSINKTSFVTRLNIGIAVPLWGSSEIPFVKQFSLGGSQSMRAWNYRELGIGGYLDPESVNQGSGSSNFYQSGDIKLELNLEYRFPIISLGSLGIVNGALFTDIGNIWSLDNDIPEANFSSDFYNQLAVGSGAGIRWDLEYFVIRVDIAWKMRLPYADENGNYYPGGDLFKNFTETPRWNLGINYPF